jgi:hypothetical protein
MNVFRTVFKFPKFVKAFTQILHFVPIEISITSYWCLLLSHHLGTQCQVLFFVVFIGVYYFHTILPSRFSI